VAYIVQMACGDRRYTTLMSFVPCIVCQIVVDINPGASDAAAAGFEGSSASGNGKMVLMLGLHLHSSCASHAQNQCHVYARLSFAYEMGLAMGVANSW
jgi:hypothetical protein